MDIQVCRMRAESYGYNLNDVVFAWTIDKQIDMAENLTLPQFSIMGHRHISCTKVSHDTKRRKQGPCRTPFSAIYIWKLHLHRSPVHTQTRDWLLLDSNLYSEPAHCCPKVSDVPSVDKPLPSWSLTLANNLPWLIIKFLLDLTQISPYRDTGSKYRRWYRGAQPKLFSRIDLSCFGQIGRIGYFIFEAHGVVVVIRHLFIWRWSFSVGLVSGSISTRRQRGRRSVLLQYGQSVIGYWN